MWSHGTVGLAGPTDGRTSTMFQPFLPGPMHLWCLLGLKTTSDELKYEMFDTTYCMHQIHHMDVGK